MGAIQYLAQSHLLVVVAGLVGHPQAATDLLVGLAAAQEGRVLAHIQEALETIQLHPRPKEITVEHQIL